MDDRRSTRAPEALEQAGHTVEEAAPEFDVAALDDSNLKAWCSFLADGPAVVAS
ncbi:hypothetical protein ACI78Q_22935 [Geodermatophilus sp. SYSU D00705]